MSDEIKSMRIESYHSDFRIQTLLDVLVEIISLICLFDMVEEDENERHLKFYISAQRIEKKHMTY